MSTSDLRLVISWFPTAMPAGPAYGDPARTTWDGFCSVFWWRREGAKDGPCFVPARFQLEPDGRHVRRLKANVVARTAVAMDVELNKATGEVPPLFADAVARVRETGWAAVVYTSHNHRPEAPRYRLVLQISGEIAPELPAVEVVADRLQLAGVLDRSKVGPSSVFYLPSANPNELDYHQTEVIEGKPIDAAWLRETAGAIRAEEEQLAAEAHAQAEARRQAKIAAGFGSNDSLIEKIRSRLDLEQILLSHGYKKLGTNFRHPNSSSGCYGADIKVFGGIERVFSHNATDPLHAGNLPSWITVTALDAFDAVAVLDYGGNRSRAMRELADRFGLSKTRERRQLAALLFRLFETDAPQEEVEVRAYAEGARLGLTRDEVVAVAQWVVGVYSAQGAA